MRRLTNGVAGVSWDGFGNIVEEDSAFEEKRRIFPLRLAGQSCHRRTRRARLLLQNRVILGDLLGAIWRRGLSLFAAKDNLLEEEDMVFAIDFRFRHHEDVVQEKFAEVIKMVPFPISNSLLQASHRLLIIRSPLRFVNLIGDTFRSN